MEVTGTLLFASAQCIEGRVRFGSLSSVGLAGGVVSQLVVARSLTAALLVAWELVGWLVGVAIWVTTGEVEIDGCSGSQLRPLVN